jgi:hypothetical protein
MNRNATGRSPWQSHFSDGVRVLANKYPSLVTLLGVRRPDRNGAVQIDLRVHTKGLKRHSDGLPVLAYEDVHVHVLRSKLLPPAVSVSHARFVGFPHVLQGMVLCIYLDASREWDPDAGATGFLNRLWSWFEDAVAGKFDSASALYHAVGGTNHESDLVPMAVVRDELPGRHARVAFRSRGQLRYDLEFEDGDELQAAPMWHASDPLPLGAGMTLDQLGRLLDDPRLERAGEPSMGQGSMRNVIDTTIRAMAKRNSYGSMQPFALCVPHPTGGAPHVLVGAIDAETADKLRDDVEVTDADIHWWRVSDERPSVTVRRDFTRPISGFQGRTVMLLGCGGIGSWLAEFIVRAGVRRIVLSDPAVIRGGLLVRQNYAELDVGAAKDVALKRRIVAIRDDISVDILGEMTDAALDDIDLLVDATVNLAMSQHLSRAAIDTTVAQVSVDPATGAYGLVLVAASAEGSTITEVDVAAGAAVENDPELEDYSRFWAASDVKMLIPTRGCSVPTFHGSAADLAAAAGIVASILGDQLADPRSGAHLFALPHAASPNARTSVFLPTHDRPSDLHSQPLTSFHLSPKS